MIRIYGQIYVIIGPADYVRYAGKHKLDRHDCQLSLYAYLTKTINRAMTHTEINRPYFMWLREMFQRGIRPNIKCIETCYSLTELNARERYWIQFYKGKYSDLLNNAEGGEGDSRIGQTPWNKGLTKETDVRIAKATILVKAHHADFSGDKNPMYGKSPTDFMDDEAILLWKKRISESGKIAQNKPEVRENQIDKHKYCSEKTRRKISEMSKKNSVIRRGVDHPMFRKCHRESTKQKIGEAIRKHFMTMDIVDYS